MTNSFFVRTFVVRKGSLQFQQKRLAANPYIAFDSLKLKWWRRFMNGLLTYYF